MKSRLFPFTIVLLVSAFLAGCGGGGGGAPATPPVNIGGIVTQPVASSGSTPSATAAPGTSSTSAPLSSKIAFSAHFVIMASADQVAQNAARKAAGASRTPLFVSPGTNGISLVISQGGTQISTQAADVSSSSPLCSTSGGSRTCNIPLNLPSGTYAFAATLYNEQPTGGAIPGGAQELGTAVASSSILIGQTNSVDFFIGAVVASLGIGTASNTAAFGSLPASGVASSYTILLIPTDASGNAISGSTSTFANQPTVTLAETGGSGHMHLVYNGNASGASATVVHASDSLQVAYDGAGSPGYYVTVSLAASGATTSTLQLSPLFVAGDSKYSGGTLTYTATAQNEAFAITEASAPGTVTYGTTSGAACPSLPTGSNPQLPVPVTGNVVGSGASATMTVTANVAPQAPTGCDVKIADNLGTSITIPIVLPSGTSAASSAVVNAQIDPTHYSTGSPATLSVTQGGTSVTSVTSRQSAPATLTVAETNDVTAPAVTPTGCSGIVTVASSLSQGTWSAGAMGALAGTITLVSLASGACSLQIADGNGQSVTVAITATLSGTMTELSTSVSHALSSYAMAIGSDGNIWVAEGSATLGRINVTSHALSEFALGSSLSGSSVQIIGITNGPDNNLWVTFINNSKGGVASISTAGSVLNVYTQGNVPTGPIVAGADGRLWWGGAGGDLNAISTSGSNSITCNGQFLAPSNNATNPVGELVESGTSLFAIQINGNASLGQPFAFSTTTSGSCTAGQISGSASGLTAPFSSSIGQTGNGASTEPGYTSAAVASDGSVWFYLCSGSEPGPSAAPCYLYNWNTGGVFAPPGTATGIAAGPDGNLWIAANFNGTGAVDKVNTAFSTSSTYTATGTGGSLSSVPGSIIAASDGNMWFVEGNGRIGYISP